MTDTVLQPLQLVAIIALDSEGNVHENGLIVPSEAPIVAEQMAELRQRADHKLLADTLSDLCDAIERWTKFSGTKSHEAVAAHDHLYASLSNARELLAGQAN